MDCRIGCVEFIALAYGEKSKAQCRMSEVRSGRGRKAVGRPASATTFASADAPKGAMADRKASTSAPSTSASTYAAAAAPADKQAAADRSVLRRAAERRTTNSSRGWRWPSEMTF